MTHYATLMFTLLVGHALADYPLQGDFLAKAKNPNAPIPGVPWYQALCAHAFIHAGAVLLITGLLPLALFELVAHSWIDYGKCKGYIGFNADQAMHIACKLAYVLVIAAGVA